jgi:hypothetical protein
VPSLIYCLFGRRRKAAILFSRSRELNGHNARPQYVYCHTKEVLWGPASLSLFDMLVCPPVVGRCGGE